MRASEFIFGKKIKFIREKCEQSLREVSRETGISGNYLSQLETGKKRNPSIKIFLALCRYYGIDPTKEIANF